MRQPLTQTRIFWRQFIKKQGHIFYVLFFIGEVSGCGTKEQRSWTDSAIRLLYIKGRMRRIYLGKQCTDSYKNNPPQSAARPALCLQPLGSVAPRQTQHAGQWPITAWSTGSTSLFLSCCTHSDPVVIVCFSSFVFSPAFCVAVFMPDWEIIWYAFYFLIADFSSSE